MTPSLSTTLRTFLFGFLLSIISMSALQAGANPPPFLSGSGGEASFRGFEDDAGGFYLAWVDASQPKSVCLRAQHIDPKGQPLWEAPGIVVTSRLASIKDWSGLADGRGGLTLFWDESDGVHAQRFQPDGTRRRPGESVLMSTSPVLQPDAVADAAGGTLVVWRKSLPSGRSVLEAQRLDTDGNPVWPEGGIRVSLRASHQTNPRVIYDNMSGMIVAWRDEVNQASELRVQRIDFQANRLWTLEGLKMTSPIGASDMPNIATLGTGAVVAAWNGLSRGTNQIFLQKAGPDAAVKWGTMTLASHIPIPYNRWNPVLLGDENGGTWIGWEDFRNQLNYQVQVNHLNGQGKSIWAGGEISAAPGLGDQGRMAMTSDGKDGVWLAWIDNRLSTVGLYVQDVNDHGALLLGAHGRLVADQLSKPSIPRLVSLSAGKAVVFWSQKPKKDQWTLSWAMIGEKSAAPE